MGSLSTDQLAALGAFLSGVAAVLSSYFSLRHIRKKAKEDCDERVAEIKEAMREGADLRKHEE